MINAKKQFKQTYDTKYNFPKDLYTGVMYAFTLSPPHISHVDNTDIQGVFEEILNRYTEVSRFFHKDYVSNACDVILYPEFSKDGRLHYHGFLKIYEMIVFTVMVVPWLKEYATLDISEIKALETPCNEGEYIPDEEDDYLRWYIYCTKNLHHFNNAKIIEYFGTSSPRIDNGHKVYVEEVERVPTTKARRGRPPKYL